MADYPLIIPNFGADEIDGVDFNYAAHINKLRAEVDAIATELGTRLTATPTVASRLATALTNIATLLSHFDGSGLLPHTGIEGTTGFTPFTPSTAWSNYRSPDAVAGWRVTAAGMCEWQGAISIAAAAFQVVLSGAPAPQDSEIHSFKVRRGTSGGYNLASVVAPFIAFADYIPQSGNMARPQFFIDECGVCHVSGTIYVNSAPTSGQAVLGYLPRPADGANHVFRLFDTVLDSGSPTVTLDPLTETLRAGSVVRGAGGESVGAAVPFAVNDAYLLDFSYQTSLEAISMDVLPDGTGYYSGPDILQGTGGSLGSDYLWLDGISYFVGP